MEQRQLGRTGIAVSVLGYGCGAIGGLMVKGSAAEQDRAIARAIDHGITYFDTAYAYGEGVSEANLGRALKALKANVTVGTKVRIYDTQRGDIAGTITASLEGSLARLGRDSVDIYQLHNAITRDGLAPSFTAEQILDDAVPAFVACATRANAAPSASPASVMRRRCDTCWKKAASPPPRCPATC